MNKTRTMRLLSLALVLLLLVGGFASIMTAELNRNEHMYHAASVLVAQGQSLYTDFAYLQTPYLPRLYGGFYDLFGVSSYYLLIGRLFSFIWLSVSALTLFLIARRELNDVAMALQIVALFLLNTTILQ